MDANSNQQQKDTKEESPFDKMSKREYQEYIWSLKRVESIKDVDGKEYPLNFLPFIL